MFHDGFEEFHPVLLQGGVPVLRDRDLSDLKAQCIIGTNSGAKGQGPFGPKGTVYHRN